MGEYNKYYCIHPWFNFLSLSLANTDSSSIHIPTLEELEVKRSFNSS